MGSIGIPKPWVPYINSKDCSQGYCSFYCPQWCNSHPPPIEFPDDDSGPGFSPLVIAVIGVIASAFLLVSYYTIISKYCGNSDSTRRENHDTGDIMEDQDNQNPSGYEPWQTLTTGLDEALIKSITVCKYKKGDGLIEGTDCPVCLNEFQEDESLRLLPKCSHAFHVYCIDKWLRSHSNCPLCRANIIFISASPFPSPLPPPGLNESLQGRQPATNENLGAEQDSGRVVPQNDVGGLQKTPLRAFSDLGNVQGRDAVILIREENYQQMRRSVSMDHFCQTQITVADIVHMKLNQEEEEEECRMLEGCHFSSPNIAGSSKQSAQGSKVSEKMRVFNCVMNPVTMKRSFSSGRLFRVGDPSISLQINT